MSQIQKMTVKGYKSIKSLVDFELRPLNVLIGANGAGKSNFISLFRLLNEMYEQQLQIYTQVQGGPDAMLHFGRGVTDCLEVEFGFLMEEDPASRVPFQLAIPLSYRFGLMPTLDNRLIFQSEESLFFGSGNVANFSHLLGRGHAEAKLKEDSHPYSQFVRQSVSKWRVYHFHDTSDTAKIKQLQATNINLRLLPDGSNLAAYLRMLKQKHVPEYQRIVETIRLVLPFFDDFIHRPTDPEFIELEWRQKGKPDIPFKAHLLSDGSLRFICLATLLLQPVSLLPDTILIDEPELGLHPAAIAILASIFQQVAEEKQLIVATHSVELINCLSPEDVIVVDQEDGVSSFRRFNEEELSDWLEEYSLGELWLRNILGGRP